MSVVLRRHPSPWLGQREERKIIQLNNGADNPECFDLEMSTLPKHLAILHDMGKNDILKIWYISKEFITINNISKYYF